MWERIKSWFSRKRVRDQALTEIRSIRSAQMDSVRADILRLQSELEQIRANAENIIEKTDIH